MQRRSACRALDPMNDPDRDTVDAATERFERRLAEEIGKLRFEMATGFGAVRADMERGFGELRSEMIHRNAELLKWVLGFLMLQLGAIAGLLALFR